MKIACRWPGGMDLALHRGKLPPLIMTLTGPPGSKRARLAPSFKVSREAAGSHSNFIQKTMVALRKTIGDEYTPRDYGVTEVSDAYWAAWYEANQHLDVVQCRIVFPLLAGSWRNFQA